MKKATQNIIKQSVICLFALTVATKTNAQMKHDPDHFRLGINMDTYINGDGHGGFYNMSGVVSSHRSSFALGPTWQKAKKEFTGMRFTYSYSVIGASPSCLTYGAQYDKREELSFFLTVTYNKGAMLSKTTIMEEGSISDELLTRYESLRLNTIESFGGMSYSYYLTNNIKLRGFIGIGVYNHLHYCENTFHDKMATVLMTGIGIGFVK